MLVANPSLYGILSVLVKVPEHYIIVCWTRHIVTTRNALSEAIKTAAQRRKQKIEIRTQLSGKLTLQWKQNRSQCLFN